MEEQSNGDRPELIDLRLAKALAHPIRVEILSRLGSARMSPNQLAEAMDLPLQNASYHMNVLEETGAIVLRETKPCSGASEHFYEPVPEAFIGGRPWRRVPASLRAASGGLALDFLTRLAIAAIEQGRFSEDGKAALIWNAICVDEEGWRELEALMEQEVPDRILAIQQRSRERLDGEPGTSVIAGVIAFEMPEPDRKGD